MFRLIIGFILVLVLLDTASAGFLPKAFEANFLQEKKSVISGRISKNFLSFKYKFPSNVSLTEQNQNTHYICNESNVWIYNPPYKKGEPGQLRKGSSSKYCYSKVFDSLSKGLTDNKLYTVKKEKNGEYTLTFRPKAKAQLGLDKLELAFDTKSTNFNKISKLRFFYTGEKNAVVLTKQSLKVVKGFPKGTFNFVPPKNTKIQLMK